jgi:hypothetical protein
MGEHNILYNVYRGNNNNMKVPILNNIFIVP